MRPPALLKLRVRLRSLLPLCLALAPLASADTIVLKNGRRIAATNATEGGGKVTYETSAGEMSLPLSIVDRIDKDNMGPAASAMNAANLGPVDVQSAGGSSDVPALAIHGKSVDYAYLANIDRDARAGDPDAIERAAVAHHVAAQYLFANGNVDLAIRQYQQALDVAPQNTGLLLNLAVIYLRQSQFSAAIEWLEKARRVAPDSPDVAKLEGWAYYGANKLDQAVHEWERAQQLRPDPEVAEALEKAKRDKSEEESYHEGNTAHFALKYSGAATPQLAREILRYLEDDFADISNQLGYTPPDQIGVILYTNQGFADITRAPAWVGALNDGRLRIPVQGLTNVTPDLARVMKHELTHSFVGQKTHQRAPVWLQEGIAQYMEGARSSQAAGSLLELSKAGISPQFATMESSWMNLSGSSVSLAYAWSLAAVEAIIDEGGMTDIDRLLDRVASEPSSEAALKDALRENYSDLASRTIAYLHRRYSH